MTLTDLATTLFRGVRITTWINDAAWQLYIASPLSAADNQGDEVLASHAGLLSSASFGALRDFLLNSGWLWRGYYEEQDVYFFIREAALCYQTAVDAGLANGGDYVDTLFAITFPATFDSLNDMREGDDEERDEKARAYYRDVLWPAVVDAGIVQEHTEYQEPEQIEL